ncbi:MAG: bifunctional methylenetetrahydrofolate dehydrogenase/methenyltetrahydrofolate cyclohydrolase FolD [Chloroflexi bacterium]|nr:bifunctional methylenetetrahydrofolate dehydrogenase/methenyltetrahydrofolate cyclohydrolase FolD [Chloroflexota bacterium]
MVRILQGGPVAEAIRTHVGRKVKQLQQQHGVTPGLAAILVGDNPASSVYVRNKERACRQAGILTETFHMPASTSQGELLQVVARLNDDLRFHGILVQLPLPPHLEEATVINAVHPSKDIDGLHPINMGRLAKGEPAFVPCTPAGVQQLLLWYGYSLEGKHVVICGRSNIVGKPLALLLLQKAPGANATVTVCHTGTVDLAGVTRQADILVVAAGRPNTITGEMVQEPTVVIDVGINRVPDTASERGYRLTGDVDFDSVAPKVQAISPVPGGVGPMTIAMLLFNTLKAACHTVGAPCSLPPLPKGDP